MRCEGRKSDTLREKWCLGWTMEGRQDMGLSIPCHSAEAGVVVVSSFDAWEDALCGEWEDGVRLPHG